MTCSWNSYTELNRSEEVSNLKGAINDLITTTLPYVAKEHN